MAVAEVAYIYSMTHVLLFYNTESMHVLSAAPDDLPLGINIAPYYYREHLGFITL